MHPKLYFLLLLVAIHSVSGYSQGSDTNKILKQNIENYITDPEVSNEIKIDTLRIFLNQAKQNLNTPDIAYAYQNLAAIHYNLGNLNESLRYYKLFALETQILIESKNFRKQDFEISLYKNEIKALNEKILTLEKEISDLETTKEEYFESNYLIYLGLRIAFVIAAIMIMGWLYIRYSKWKKARNKSTRIVEENDQKLSELLVNTRDQLTELQTEMDLSDILIQYSIKEPGTYFNNNKSLRRKFLIHQPKKLVGGDGLYLQSVKSNTVVAVFDTPGHGVSGGLLSSQIAKQLEKLVINHGILSPAILIQQLESKIRKLFPAGIPFSGGIEIGICLYNSSDKIISYAGANMNLLVIHQGIINRYRGSNVMLLVNEEETSLTNSSFDVHKGMNLYLSTDGFWKQKGGHEVKPLGTKAYEKAIESMYPQPVREHGEILSKILSDWKGLNEQDDDVLVFGFGF